MAAGPVRRVPTRSCVACRTARPKRDLVRIVRTPTGSVVVDPTGRLSGRGAYVCRDGDCALKAIDKGALARALETRIPAELGEMLLGAGMTMTDGGGADGKE